MNYFAHYYFDCRDGDAYHNLGLILPDLARGLDGRKRLLLEAIGDNHNREIQAMKAGCEMHLRRDLHFHESKFFTTTMAGMEQLLTAANFPGERIRMWFLVHVGVELLLDRVLMQREGEMLSRFYADLRTVDMLLAIEFLSICGKTNAERYPEIHGAFTSSRYLYGYLDDRQLMFALNRTLTRAKQQPMNSAQDAAFVAALPEVLAMISDLLPDFIDESKQL